MNRFSLDKKIIVVTGAAGILGSFFCRELVAAGAHVIAIDAQAAALAVLRDGLPSPQLETYCADIREREQVADIRASLLSRYGHIDGLLNNAATKSPNFFESFESFPLEDWDYVMSVNLKGAMVCCQEFGTVMAEQGCGSIVNVLSIYGIAAPDQRIYEGSEYLGRAINTPAVYSASKAGLWGLTHYLSSYWGHRDVRVNALTPGGIQSGQNTNFIDRYSQRVPLGRMGQPEDLVGALVYLMSDASSYVTGQNIVVDGGLTVW
ncbi:SDR family oxidoreductase [Chitinimonas taiwanensis]|uniref:NAD(P)-dependent dehydrogenase, short-chain alcohol dehydrogenase family n=1 Tax=Chitinimonas taiwanensis DSM 18899 TaxID=1121279 RepID=A0A1K2HQ44_9NEIS|nr:SDR family oxidoreductase [Chitinimonas taiwanensis]SFZ78879.1 NAD(P)-dependent dehydrogenase, short-chain alcohol dehydrogenase family [Chitinimonas taiwanensis DSM 18899]